MSVQELQRHFMFGGNLDRDEIQVLFNKIEMLREELGIMREGMTERGISISNLNSEIGKLKFQINSIQSTLESVQVVMNGSHGVVGWHLNGEVATWSELGLEDEIADALKAGESDET